MAQKRRSETTPSLNGKPKKKKGAVEPVPEDVIRDPLELMKKIIELISTRTIVGVMYSDETDKDPEPRLYPKIFAECFINRGLRIRLKGFSTFDDRGSPIANTFTKAQLQEAELICEELLKPFHGTVKELVPNDATISVIVLPYGASHTLIPIPPYGRKLRSSRSYGEKISTTIDSEITNEEEPDLIDAVEPPAEPIDEAEPSEKKPKKARAKKSKKQKASKPQKATANDI